MEEIWKDYIYNYQVSNLGNFRNKVNNRLLKQRVSETGYYVICISLGSRNNKKTIRVHKAIAEAFIPNPENKPQVNHIDGNKLNNCVNNLEWVTASENIQHAFDNGLNKPKRGYEHSSSKLTKEDVLFIRKNYMPRDKEFGCRALARKYDVDHMQIVNIIKNKTYKNVELM